MPAHLDLDLLDRYLTGACTADEQAVMERWLAADPSRSLAGLTGAGAYPASLGAPDAAWTRVHERTAAPAPTRTRHLTSAGGAGTWSRGLWRTASVLAAACVAVVGWRLIAARSARNIDTPPANLREYVTPHGRRAELTLQDGSRVVLNAGSRLRVKLDDTARVVYLEGEAQFTVQHDPRAPFTVHAGNSVTRDLATTFAIRAYPNDAAARVVVRDGRVSVKIKAVSIPSAVTLVPGQLATVRAGSIDTATVRDFDAYFGWTRGHLVFDNATVAEVLTELERTYDVTFRVTDAALLRDRMSATITSATLDAALLHDLEQLLAVRLERNGQIITVSAAGRAPARPTR